MPLSAALSFNPPTLAPRSIHRDLAEPWTPFSASLSRSRAWPSKFVVGKSAAEEEERQLCPLPRSRALGVPCTARTSARMNLVKGLTGKACKEREGMTGGPNLLTGGVMAGLLCGYRGRMGVRANFKRF